jgi:hypothetical protein
LGNLLASSEPLRLIKTSKAIIFKAFSSFLESEPFFTKKGLVGVKGAKPP